MVKRINFKISDFDFFAFLQSRPQLLWKFGVPSPCQTRGIKGGIKY